jgi:HPt (histidine-containing phosphotransfer) domain-containing protein
MFKKVHRIEITTLSYLEIGNAFDCGWSSGAFSLGMALALLPGRVGHMKKFVAQVDPDVYDLMPGFLARKRSETRVILSAVSAAAVDFEEVSRIGHRLKGEGGSYGLDSITVYGTEIEQAARKHDAAAIRHYANELAAYLDSLQIECGKPV